MRWRASIGAALLTLSHLVSASVSSALAQAGSTGGTIGKQDKSISGEDHSAPPAQRSRRSARTRDDDGTGSQTAASLRGYWRIQVNCGSHQSVLERGGRWSFDIKAISGNTFAGGFDQGGKTDSERHQSKIRQQKPRGRVAQLGPSGPGGEFVRAELAAL